MKPQIDARGSRLTALLAGVLTLALVTGACGGPQQVPQNPSGPTIVIGSSGWKEDVAVNSLWTTLLERRGYDVEIRHLTATTVFRSLANDGIDLFLDAWLPNTHRDKMRAYGDSLAKIGAWYDNGTLEWTVPAYLENIDSIADLRGKAAMFDGKIIGIDPTAGITQLSKNKVLPAYGLADSYKLQIGTGSSMTRLLGQAIAAKEPIVVTLWHPHVAYTKWDLKDLADPKGALGSGEQLWVLSRSTFAEDKPRVAKWLKNFQLNQKQLRALEDLMYNKYPDDRSKAIDQWIGNHQKLIAQWIPKAGGA